MRDGNAQKIKVCIYNVGRVGVEKNVAYTYFSIVSKLFAVIILVPALGDIGVDTGVLTTGEDAHAIETQVQSTRYNTCTL